MLYFVADTVDPNNPTSFCTKNECPWLMKNGSPQGIKQDIFTCTGPTPFNDDAQYLATIPFNRTILDHVDALFDEKLKPFTAPCGANQRMFFDARVAGG